MTDDAIRRGWLRPPAPRRRLLAAGVLAGWLGAASGIPPIPPKPATPITAARNAAVYGELDFADQQDFVDAQRGFIAGLEPPRIITNDLAALNALGLYAWNMESYQFLNATNAPASVNPSLWRQERLNNLNGLFEVLSNTIYQVRSYDLATMSFVKTDNGWIVIDPLTSKETARAGLALLRAHVSSDPVVAILSSHSHIDHYGGVSGILAAEGKTIAPDTTPAPGELLYYAPDHFYEESLSENLYLGNTMFRRADYMYGSYLARGPLGHVGSGLGKTTGFGASALYRPSAEIGSNGTVTIDGLEVMFQLAPGTEAPAEMHIFFPAYGAFCPGENVSHTMHNLLTSRGAKVRDPKAFAQYIDEAIRLFGPQIEVLIGVHHWPVWGNARCLKLLQDQRDLYRFFNDQVIRLLNHGMNMEEIAEAFELPVALASVFYNRGYYGTLNHNVKAVAQRYVGWWDGNPANYYKYPEAVAARKYVDFMGGENAVIAKARQCFAQGDYRWVAEVLKHVVFANPANQEAKSLQADAFEQLGYAFESGTWRNIFLSGAEELRNGTIGPPATGASAAGSLAQMTPRLIFDYLSTLIKGKDAEHLTLSMRFVFTDPDLPATETNLYVLLHNGVLHCWNDKPGEPAGATYTLTQARLLALLTAPSDLSGITVEGDGTLFAQLAAQFDTVNRLWNLVLPLDYDNSRSNRVVKANQVITFPAIPDQVVTTLVVLSATASSGLPVSFAVEPGPGAIPEPNRLAFSGTGLVAIAARQAGNSNWNAAAPVINTFAVTPIPIQGVAGADFDGDRLADPTIYDSRTGTWTDLLSGLGYARMVSAGLLGGPGYAPAAADYDADRFSDPAVYQESTGNWMALLSGNGYTRLDRIAYLGGPGWTPAAADYEGDRQADYAVYQETTGNWSVKLSSAAYAQTDLAGFLGGPGYRVAPADFDGDGLADPAVYHRASGTWKMLLSGSGYGPLTLSATLGGTGWEPVPGDYDGDGLADPAVRKSDGSEWRVLMSGSGYVPLTVPLGL